MDFHVLTSAGPEHICSLVDGKVVIVPPSTALAKGRGITQPAAQAGIVCRDDDEHHGDERGNRITPQVVPAGPRDER